MAANSLPVLDRLIGQETEYAIRLSRLVVPRPTNFSLYQELVRRVQGRMPTAEARHFKWGVFLANGGAIWFEIRHPARECGLIEGSTPECRGPRQLLCYQRAQDRLLAEAAGAGGPEAAFTLLKNDHDGSGNYYGVQENYEATIASGVGLTLWRVGLVLVVPLMVLSWIGLLALITAMLIYFLLAGIVYLPLRLLSRQGRRVALFLFSSELVGEQYGDDRPHWLHWISYFLMCLIVAPLAAGLIVLLWLVAFRVIRRQLVPFLITRTVLSGSGMLDAQNNFQLAQKATAVNCLLGYNRLVGDRPIFGCGHFFKTMLYEAWRSPSRYLRLFQRRQRIQICLGDSNMAEVAEYLRIGTTLLVLDTIEAGRLPKVPRLRRPLRSLRQIIGDATLTARVAVTGGEELTALEIQRWYLGACRRFLSDRGGTDGEAHDLLRRWEETLDSLEHDSRQLVGQIDWVTKKYLLETSGKDAEWDARRKIDLRYHELSAEGYFERLKATGVVANLVSDPEIDWAIRMPPPDTPAATRGRHIREFSRGPGRLTVDWQSLVLRVGGRRKVFRLTGLRRSTPGSDSG